MIDILTAASMKNADQTTIDSGISSQTLMERAAKAALSMLKQKFDTSLVLFLCGSGNNGGDGLAMARFFAEQGGAARVLYLGALTEDGKPDPSQMSTECARQFSLLPPKVELCTVPNTRGVTAVVDAIFGIGLTRPIEGHIKEVIEAVRACALPTLAVDIPSGLHADTGAIMGTVLPATVTVAIAAPKFGHFLYPGAGFCGHISTVDIGVHSQTADGRLLEKTDLAALPPRPANAHKGRFGRVLIIGGSVGMSGAGHFAAKAALRAGAGLVEIFAPVRNRTIHQIQLPEALLTLYDPENFDENTLLRAIARADAVAIGMGLSQSEAARRMVSCALRNTDAPLLVDADALNLMAGDIHLLTQCASRTQPTVLTPHLMEMSRLSGKAVPLIAADPVAHATGFAKQMGAIIVQKDARTVVTDGEDVYLNALGNSGMATGGSGDALAGIIASLAAQGASAIDAARLGVLIHAMAGDAALTHCGNHGMIASDIIDGICEVLP